MSKDAPARAVVHEMNVIQDRWGPPTLEVCFVAVNVEELEELEEFARVLYECHVASRPVEIAPAGEPLPEPAEREQLLPASSAPEFPLTAGELAALERRRRLRLETEP